MRFIDSYFYKPNIWQKALSFALLPFSALYLAISIINRKIKPYRDFGIPIISVGNLVAGGTGKTPFLLELVKDYPHPAIISRGFKRKSKGLIVVSVQGKILSDEESSGDEAYMSALLAKNASVIVSKDRIQAIRKAKELGAQCVFLDDGFRFNFKKLNIILTPKLKPHFRFPLPSGMYRENPFYKNPSDVVLQEGEDYTREVKIENPTQRMLLLSAIANPARLREFLPANIVGKIELGDHARFDVREIQSRFDELKATSLLVTHKDKVKLHDCKMPLSTLVLHIHIKKHIKEQVAHYITKNAIASK